ncbi:bacterial regulatory helix-turn-helix, lysR family protein [Burkholderia pseudomallei ABCPW 107]|uniref:LysR family transcriptional regulator n=1 Tax=Burkholderia pseudomallei TaxID=28450 RepID=UPI000530E73E|nr:LysR family transcriptional regulator [Burkholderia pseudomallei]KGS48850.1 bacterial regulatory helix-turn-helix, lysR family protein [Burkholderia pseudomallei ABCPW 107]
MTMKRDPLGGLHVFMSVVTHGNFTRAAAALGLTPAAVSLAIGQLESELKVKLFSRSTRGVSLTEAGQRYYDATAQPYRQVVDARDALNDARDEPEGLLRISALHLAKSVVTADVLAEFFRRYPKVSVEIRYEDHLVDIVKERLDAGIRLADRLQPGMVGVKIAPALTCALVATPGYLAQHGVPAKLADLARHMCIRFRFPKSGRLHKWPLRDGRRDVELDVAGRFVSTDTGAVIDAARAGAGIAFVFMRERIEDDLRRDTLREVLPGACRTLPPMWLYYANRKHVPPKLRAFIAVLREHAAADARR